MITTEILDLCQENDVTISVSLDGPRHIHDRNRVGFDTVGTYDLVMEGLDRLRSHPAGHQIFSGLLAVIDPSSDATEIYSFFKELTPPSLDFIYRDGNHSRLPPGKASPLSTEYGQWMARLFEAYVADATPIRIRLLDDMVKLVLGGTGTKEGVGLNDYRMLVIDTDGSITKNDTLKSSFDGQTDSMSLGRYIHIGFQTSSNRLTSQNQWPCSDLATRLAWLVQNLTCVAVG